MDEKKYNNLLLSKSRQQENLEVCKKLVNIYDDGLSESEKRKLRYWMRKIYCSGEDILYIANRDIDESDMIRLITYGFSKESNKYCFQRIVKETDFDFTIIYLVIILVYLLQ